MRNWGNLWILSDLSNNIHIYHPIYLNKVVEPPSGCFPHCLQRYKFWCLFYSLVISLWCPFGYVSLSSGFLFLPLLLSCYISISYSFFFFHPSFNKHLCSTTKYQALYEAWKRIRSLDLAQILTDWGRQINTKTFSVTLQ